MSATVDVLSVLDQAIERERQAGQATVAQIAARAAVAELIAASRDAAAVLQDKAGPMEQETPRRLFAAIARVGGAV